MVNLSNTEIIHTRQQKYSLHAHSITNIERYNTFIHFYNYSMTNKFGHTKGMFFFKCLGCCGPSGE